MSIRKKLSTLSPALTLMVAVLLILRGLSLGIPYVSPKQPQLNNPQTAVCHTIPKGIACPVPNKPSQP